MRTNRVTHIKSLTVCEKRPLSFFIVKKYSGSPIKRERKFLKLGGS
ncbi:hypothetical protein CHCC20375_3879 [Bacillus licheniformis]|nr:hypothetical protein CHCC20375_3879 [Bacillus licheniformis]